MMIILCVSNCPANLKGDLSKWLTEVNVGVYIGKLSGRVRDELWERVCKNVNQGQATLVYTTNNEQGFEFRVHNTNWRLIDYEGIKLMQRPLNTASRNKDNNFLNKGFSNAAKYEKIKYQSKKEIRNEKKENYVIVDIETTGLNETTDYIIEIGAVRICEGNIFEKFECLVKPPIKLPSFVVKLTGITDEIIQEKGIDEKEAIKKFLLFIGTDKLMGYNISFDLKFIKRKSEKYGINPQIKQIQDVLPIARKKIDEINDFKLETVANFFNENDKQYHRALLDCELIYRVLLKLNEIK
jgi:CRISPR-associated protein Cas2